MERKKPFQGSSANSVGGDSGQDGRTDSRDNHNIPTLFKKRGDKDNFGWVWPIMGGAPQVEIDRIAIREFQYKFEVNRCRNEEIIVKGNFGWWLGRPRVGNGAMHKVQYQFEVNRCRNEEIIVKGLVMGTCIAEIDCIVIREVQYQFEVNRCRNEEIIVKGNFGWAWPMWAWPMWARCPRIDRKVIREVQYQFEVTLCRNEEFIVKDNFGWAWHMWPGRPRIDRIVIREAQYQFEVNRYRNEEVNFQGSSGQDGQKNLSSDNHLTDRRTDGPT
ncbi:hypothetical protein DPMN_014712 [Dreissena polymorpha]|uniref:Uncharacterized protein n=1 Tax=Dreissena polymorpha TaxID=45954 RepID=A0A9D4S5H3_DREPO|nr:hypothetical protein DPMN_014712 [Dreissena polymorpha]